MFFCAIFLFSYPEEISQKKPDYFVLRNCRKKKNIFPRENFQALVSRNPDLMLENRGIKLAAKLYLHTFCAC